MRGRETSRQKQTQTDRDNRDPNGEIKIAAQVNQESSAKEQQQRRSKRQNLPLNPAGRELSYTKRHQQVCDTRTDLKPMISRRRVSCKVGRACNMWYPDFRNDLQDPKLLTVCCMVAMSTGHDSIQQNNDGSDENQHAKPCQCFCQPDRRGGDSHIREE